MSVKIHLQQQGTLMQEVVRLFSCRRTPTRGRSWLVVVSWSVTGVGVQGGHRKRRLFILHADCGQDSVLCGHCVNYGVCVDATICVVNECLLWDCSKYASRSHGHRWCYTRLVVCSSRRIPSSDMLNGE